MSFGPIEVRVVISSCAKVHGNLSNEMYRYKHSERDARRSPIAAVRYGLGQRLKPFGLSPMLLLNK
jgi:hypothetical protein